MPKQIKNILGFKGGELNKFDPRDIPDEALSKSVDVMMDIEGKIRLMGKEDEVLVDSDMEEGFPASFRPGWGAYSFRADRHITLSGNITASVTYTYSGTAYTKLTTEHKFGLGNIGAGAHIYIYGIPVNLSLDDASDEAVKARKLLRRHKILYVVDANNFVINLLHSDLGTNNAEGTKWIWNPGPWGIRPYIDILGEYCNAAVRDQRLNNTDDNWSYCSATFNPSFSDAIVGNFIYTAIQDDHAIGIYHSYYDVFIRSAVTLRNRELNGTINAGSVISDMVYAGDSLRVSNGVDHTTTRYPKLFGYHSRKNWFIKSGLSDTDGTGNNAYGVTIPGKWNVWNGDKDDVPGSQDSDGAFVANKGYIESRLRRPSDLFRGGFPASQDLDISNEHYNTGLQFRITQLNTRDVADENFMLGSNGDTIGNSDADAEGLTGNKTHFGDNVTTIPIYPIDGNQVYMVIGADTHVSGDWQGEDDHASLRFGASWVYGTPDNFQESQIMDSHANPKIYKENNPEARSGSIKEWINNMSFKVEFFIRHDQGIEGHLEHRWGEDDKASNDGDNGNVNKEGKTDPRKSGMSIYITDDDNGSIDDPLYFGTVWFNNEIGGDIEGTKSEEGGFVDSYGNRYPWKKSIADPENGSYIGNNGGYGDTTVNYDDGTWTNDVVIGCPIRRVPTLTYKLRNLGLEPYAHSFGDAARWTTSLVANNRLFIGNTSMLNGTRSERNKVYGDRMLISPELMYDIIPQNSFIDVATNDGEGIVKLEYFRGKLLQFKHTTVYVIDISGEMYGIQSSHKYIGIKNRWSVTNTPGGIIWANNNGVYVFDGESIKNLIDNKIHSDTWNNFCGGLNTKDSPLVGYLPKEKQIVVVRSPEGITYSDGGSGDVWIYDVQTESWTFGINRVSNQVKTNLLSSFNDKCTYGVMGGSVTETPLSVITTLGIFSSVARGSVYFEGGSSGGNQVTLQYYKGGTDGTDGTWTTTSRQFFVKNGWHTQPSGRQNLAQLILDAVNAYHWIDGNNELLVDGFPDYYPNESGSAGMHLMLKGVLVGTAHNTGKGEIASGYNSFRLNGAGTEWTTTGDNTGENPDVGTTNSVTNWVTTEHMSGGVGTATAQVSTITILRNGSTIVGVVYLMKVSITEFWDINNDGNHAYQFEKYYTYTTVTADGAGGSDAANNQLVAANIVETLKSQNSSSDNPTDDGGSDADDNNEDVNFDIEDYITIGSASSGVFTLTSKDAGRQFDFNITVLGDVILKKFDSPSEQSTNVLFETKEFDLGEPNVRKKIYKLYMTYKSDDTSAAGNSESNIRVYYSMNNTNTWYAMKVKGSSVAAGTASNVPSSATFTQTELIPNPSSSANKPNKIYSIKFKVSSEQSSGGTKDRVDGFELNDLSIVFRTKSIK